MKGIENRLLKAIEEVADLSIRFGYWLKQKVDNRLRKKYAKVIDRQIDNDWVIDQEYEKLDDEYFEEVYNEMEVVK